MSLSHLLQIHFNILLPTTPGSSKWSLFFTSPQQNPVYMPFPSHSSWLDHRTICGEQYRSLSSSLRSFLHSPVTSSLLGPNIPLSNLFSNTLSLHSSLIVSDQVSDPYKTTGKITVHYILIFIFWVANWRQKILHRMTASIAFPQSALNLFLNITLDF